MGQANDPRAAVDWTAVAYNLLMQGRAAEAVRELSLAPKFGALASDPVFGRWYADVVPSALARSLLELQDIAGALRAMPEKASVPPEDDKNVTGFAPHAVRGEVWCATGRTQDGLSLLSQWIDANAPQVSENAPGVARVRAVAGCARSKPATANAPYSGPLLLARPSTGNRA